MARIVRFATIVDERLRERDHDSNRGGGTRSLWRRLSTIRWEFPLVAIILFSVAYIVAAVLPEGTLVRLFPAQQRDLNLFQTSSVPAMHFSKCIGSVRYTCVVDGDTIWLEGSKIRIADIDTPEVSRPSCSEELALGKAATQRMITLLNQGSFVVEPYARDEDVYGRKLRILSRNGRSLGMMLVDEGLAHVWDGSKHSWCG